MIIIEILIELVNQHSQYSIVDDSPFSFKVISASESISASGDFEEITKWIAIDTGIKLSGNMVELRYLVKPGMYARPPVRLDMNQPDSTQLFIQKLEWLFDTLTEDEWMISHYKQREYDQNNYEHS